MLKRLIDTFLSHRKISAFLLGSVSVQAFPPFYHWYLLLICWSGLLCLINRAASKKQAFSTGYWFGFGFFAFGLLWVSNALLINSAETGWLIPVTFIASGAFFGLFIGIPALLCWLTKPLISRYISLCAWTIFFEWIRSWILTGFPWNLWGSTLTFDINMIQAASFFGTYGLSLCVLLTASAPALWFEKRNKRSALICLSLLIIIPTVLYCYGLFRIKRLDDATDSNVKIRLVQPSIPQSIKWSPDLKEEHFKKYINLSSSQSSDNINMIIWGETASPYALDLNKKAQSQLSKIIPTDGYLLTGLIRYQDDYYGGWLPFNSSLILNHSGIIEDFYDKSHLVPFGEYIPLRQWLPDFIQPVANIISNLNAGTGPKIINIGNIPPFGIQICYEIIFPHQVITSDQKPQWLINLTNDGWYGNSAGPYQHFVSAQLRAVEEGLTIVRSANSGISGLINRYGKTIDLLALNQESFLDITLPEKLETPTLYNYWGNKTILVLCLILLLASLYLNKKLKSV